MPCKVSGVGEYGSPRVSRVGVWGAGPRERGLSGERGTEERRETEVCGTGDITLSVGRWPQRWTQQSSYNLSLRNLF